MDNEKEYKNEENKKIDTAFKLLNAFSKKVTEINDNYVIFLPQFIVKEKKINLNFPVFNRENGQLISWLVYDFNIYVYEKRGNEKNFQIDMQKYSELDYKNKKYHQNLELFVDILATAKMMLKIEKDKADFEKLTEELKEKIEEYDRLLNDIVIEELYSIYFESEYIKTEDLLENESFEVKEEKQSNEETSIIEKLIEFSENVMPKQNIDFEWEQKNGLRYVSDESLELAYEILTKIEISLNFENGKIRIHNNMINVCDEKYTTKDFLTKLKDDENITAKSKDFSISQDLTVDRICYGCKFQKCPKHLAGYIYYLINKNLLVEKLEDRKKFREENEVNDTYAFDWKFGDILRMIPDDIYNFSYELNKRNLVYVDKYLKNDKVVVNIPYSCTEIKLMRRKSSENSR